MYRYEKGVSGQSDIYFYTPGAAAEKTFFYLVCLGHFWCDEQYCIRRPSFDSYLIIYVKNGSGVIETGGRSRRVGKGDLVFLDCYAPHAYYADPSWEICWFHFDGPCCRNYYEMVQSQSADIVRSFAGHSFEPVFNRLISMFEGGGRIREYMVSKYITDILTLFLQAPLSGQETAGAENVTEEAVTYICSHLNEDLDLEFLACKCSLSRYHFIRVFKKETGYTPHEFIISARMNQARYYLKTTAMTIKEISFLCGFRNESSFCTSFKKMSGQTPSEYRQEGE